MYNDSSLYVQSATKFEVSTYTHYEDLIGVAQCRKWGGMGRLGSLNGIGNVTIRLSAYDFQFDFNRNCASTVFEIGLLFVESRRPTPPAFGVPIGVDSG